MGSYGTSSHIYTVDYKTKGDKNKRVRRTTNIGMYLESGDRAHCACSHSIPKFQQAFHQERLILFIGHNPLFFNT